MMALIEDNTAAIAALCDRYGIRRLSLFGSAAKGTFDPATSDIDPLVDFVGWGPGIARRFMRLIAVIEDVLGFKVHITTSRSAQSEWFQRELAETAQTIYEADASAAA